MYTWSVLNFNGKAITSSLQIAYYASCRQCLTQTKRTKGCAFIDYVSENTLHSCAGEYDRISICVLVSIYDMYAIFTLYTMTIYAYMDLLEHRSRSRSFKVNRISFYKPKDHGE